MAPRAAGPAEIEVRRAPFLKACCARFDAAAALEERIAGIALVHLRQAFKVVARKAAVLEFSPAFEDGQPFMLVAPDEENPSDGTDPFVVALSNEGHTVTRPDEALAVRVRLSIALAIRLRPDDEMTRAKLLKLPVPKDEAAVEALRAALGAIDPLAAEAAVEAERDVIDRIVGSALGLSANDIALVQTDMREDPFLGRVRPRHPFFPPAQRGRRTALESAERCG